MLPSVGVIGILGMVGTRAVCVCGISCPPVFPMPEADLGFPKLRLLSVLETASIVAAGEVAKLLTTGCNILGCVVVMLNGVDDGPTATPASPTSLGCLLNDDTSEGLGLGVENIDDFKETLEEVD